MRIYVLGTVYLLCCLCASAQQIKHRMILFGDAGEINTDQSKLIDKAAELVLAGRTSTYFLGDNIYELGMNLPESGDSSVTADILRHQYSPFTQKGVPVTFMAGNHDWDKSGERGLEKVIAQQEFLQKQQSPLLSFVPKAGTGDVFSVDLTDGLRLIFYDSEYWLFPHHQHPDSAVNGLVRERFKDSLRAIARHSGGKTLLVLSHHPMLSFGEHGKNFTLKDHIFPLTRLNQKLYVPLPVLGSIYPLLRERIISTPEDMSHKVYKRLIDDVQESLGGHSDIIYIAGHDHGLQYIEDGDFRQIVSGAGSKRSYIQKNKKQKYRSNHQGFALLDVLADDSLRLSFYTALGQELSLSYQTRLEKDHK